MTATVQGQRKGSDKILGKPPGSRTKKQKDRQLAIKQQDSSQAESANNLKGSVQNDNVRSSV